MAFVNLKTSILRNSIIGALLSFSVISVQSQSLSDAVQIALAQYPTILAAQARYDASKSAT
jgi:hypothetical protein